MNKRTLILILLITFFLLSLAEGLRIARAFNDIKNLKESAAILDGFDKIKFHEITRKSESIIAALQPFDFFLGRNAKTSSDWNLVNDAIGAKEIIGDFLSFDQEKTYLLVMQNNAEIRPSGGFWGAYGVLKIKDGKVTSFLTKNAYLADLENKGKFDPPKEAAEFFDDEWRFYSSNWDPEFEKSVQNGLFFLGQLPNSEKIDGVIGPNLDYLIEMLKISGPIEIEGKNFSIDSDNFMQKMVYEPVDPAVYMSLKQNQENYIMSDDKKIMLSDFAMKIFKKIVDKGAYRQAANITMNALKNHDLQLYSPDPKVEDKIKNLGYTVQFPTNRNFLMVNDANMGSKLDLNVDKNAVVTKTGLNSYHLEITYKNNRLSGQSLSHPFISYRNAVRIFVPSGSKLLGYSGGQKIPENRIDKKSGATFFDNLLIAEPGEKETLSFDWQVPEKNISDIIIIRQSGSHIQLKETDARS